MTFDEAPVRELLSMLTYARPYNTSAESEFVSAFIGDLEGVNYDRFGNAYLRLGTAPVMFSCHTDTVHWKEGKQKIAVDREGIAKLSPSDKFRGMCLGADDAAGVWLMRQMAKRGVSGLYVFHTAEERGGLGSQYASENHKEFFTDINYAIAFDRRADHSVITHQWVGRCCSEEFAWALAGKLNDSMGRKLWKPDNSGVFTDTANYVDLIGECTNISVGYYDEHGIEETLDIGFLLWLADAMQRFDCSGLPYVRQPGEIDPDDWQDYGDKIAGANDDTKWDKWDRTFRPSVVQGGASGRARTWLTDDKDAIEAEFYDETLVDLVREYPNLAAQVITDLGGSAEDLLDIARVRGYDV